MLPNLFVYKRRPEGGKEDIIHCYPHLDGGFQTGNNTNEKKTSFLRKIVDGLRDLFRKKVAETTTPRIYDNSVLASMRGISRRLALATSLALLPNIAIPGCGGNTPGNMPQDNLPGISSNGDNFCAVIGSSSTPPKPRVRGTRSSPHFVDDTNWLFGNTKPRAASTFSLFDFNEDGRPDLFLPDSQEFVEPSPETSEEDQFRHGEENENAPGDPLMYFNCPGGMKPFKLADITTGDPLPSKASASFLSDFDQDGRMEMFIASDGRSTNTLYRVEPAPGHFRFINRKIWEETESKARVTGLATLDINSRRFLHVARMQAYGGEPTEPKAYNPILELKENGEVIEVTDDFPALRKASEHDTYAFSQIPRRGKPSILFEGTDKYPSSAFIEGNPLTEIKFPADPNHGVPGTTMGAEQIYEENGGVINITAETGDYDKTTHRFTVDDKIEFVEMMPTQPRQNETPGNRWRTNTWDVAKADADLDGNPDVFMGAGISGISIEERMQHANEFKVDIHQVPVCLAGSPNGTFTDCRAGAGDFFDYSNPKVRDAYKVVAADMDLDGCQDLIFAPMRDRGPFPIPITFLRNSCDYADAFTGVVLARDDIGAFVIVRAGGREWIDAVQGDGLGGRRPETIKHSGLGKGIDRIDEIVIEHTDGTVVKIPNPPIDTYIFEKDYLPTSSSK